MGSRLMDLGARKRQEVSSEVTRKGRREEREAGVCGFGWEGGRNPWKLGDV